VITLVLAHNIDRFRDWCHERDIDPQDRSVRYVRDSQDLRGLGQPVKVEVAPGYWDVQGAGQSKIVLYYDALHVQERNKDLPDPGPTSR
jgi:hypothetical protein